MTSDWQVKTWMNKEHKVIIPAMRHTLNEESVHDNMSNIKLMENEKIAGLKKQTSSRHYNSNDSKTKIKLHRQTWQWERFVTESKREEESEYQENGINNKPSRPT